MAGNAGIHGQDADDVCAALKIKRFKLFLQGLAQAHLPQGEWAFFLLLR